ncbi:MAG: transcriptional repressor [Candidatus Hydrogenedentes bacterium]|nr:transcriptional repressor [Candidatus Hydrogenedentota bacterium]
MDAGGTGSSRVIETRMRGAGLRVTRPRLAVYALLRDLGGHHSADEVLRLLQGRRIAMSRASVFNVLNDLTGAGLVMLCDAGPGRTLYEAFDHWHHHFVCRQCQRILDVPCTQGEKPCLHPELPGPGYLIDEAQVIFRGLCPACREAQRDS